MISKNIFKVFLIHSAIRDSTAVTVQVHQPLKADIWGHASQIFRIVLV